jgi:hypothetical protein
MLSPESFGRKTLACVPLGSSQAQGSDMATQDNKHPMTEVAKVGQEIMQHVLQAYTGTGGVHGESVIGALAALNGEFALRATTKILPTGEAWVDGTLADGLLFAGEQAGRWSIWTIVYGYAVSAGAPQSAIPDIREITQRVEKSKGGDNFPPLSVPKEHFLESGRQKPACVSAVTYKTSPRKTGFRPSKSALLSALLWALSSKWQLRKDWTPTLL